MLVNPEDYFSISCNLIAVLGQTLYLKIIFKTLEIFLSLVHSCIDILQKPHLKENRGMYSNWQPFSTGLSPLQSVENDLGWEAVFTTKVAWISLHTFHLTP